LAGALRRDVERKHLTAEMRELRGAGTDEDAARLPRRSAARFGLPMSRISERTISASILSQASARLSAIRSA